MDTSNFYVITVISNPMRFKSRYNLYRNFKKHVEDAGAKLITVEIGFGDRPFEITKSGTTDVQLRTFDELWTKENMINIAISRLPINWEYVAWVDADITFVRPDWVVETVHQLQKFMFVQLFSKCIDMGPKQEVMEVHNGFVWSYFEDNFGSPKAEGYGSKGFWHPGYAWGARKEAIDSVGGLIDVAILGAADHHMALAMIGLVDRSYPGDIHESYKRYMKRWEEKCERHIKRDIGYLDGLIMHHFHGKKIRREYQKRWQILTNNDFDWENDIKKDAQGLYIFHGDKYKLRDQIRAYFMRRDEDSIDI